MPTTIASILTSSRLRDTQPRRMVLEVLMHHRCPYSPKELFAHIRKKESAINLVTVYRILRQFESAGIVHLHPTTGKYVLCTAIGDHACHSFLTCEQCGSVEEVQDEQLCTVEHRIAQNAGFAPRYHVSDVVGICARCQ